MTIELQVKSNMLESLLKQLDLCYFEVSEAFNGLQDENVWVRPHPNLLSIGELAGHVSYWEAMRFAGDEEGCDRDLSNCRISSPLLNPQFGYYSSSVLELPNGEFLKLTPEQVLSEMLRIHNEAMQHLKTLNPDLASKAPHWHSTYEELLRYVAFHIAYHTGQMYSVRHLMGESTPDN